MLTLNVAFESSTRTVQQIELSADASLEVVYAALKDSCPELSEDFVFLFRGKPIFREFWDVFAVADVAPLLVIRLGYVQIQFTRTSSGSGRLSKERLDMLPPPEERDSMGVGSMVTDSTTRLSAKRNASKRALALFSYKAKSEDQMSFDAGEELVVMIQRKGKWWFAKSVTRKDRGWVPHNFLQLVEEE